MSVCLSVSLSLSLSLSLTTLCRKKNEIVNVRTSGLSRYWDSIGPTALWMLVGVRELVLCLLLNNETRPCFGAVVWDKVSQRVGVGDDDMSTPLTGIPVSELQQWSVVWFEVCV